MHSLAWIHEAYSKWRKFTVIYCSSFLESGESRRGTEMRAKDELLHCGACARMTPFSGDENPQRRADDASISARGAEVVGISDSYASCQV